MKFRFNEKTKLAIVSGIGLIAGLLLIQLTISLLTQPEIKTAEFGCLIMQCEGFQAPRPYFSVNSNGS